MPREPRRHKPLRVVSPPNALARAHADLAGQIQENVELVLQKAVTPAARRGGPDDEVAELRRRIEADQRLLIQFAEEKVQLGVQGYDLLDAHGAQLDLDIRDLTEELAERAQVGRGGVCGARRRRPLVACLAPPPPHPPTAPPPPPPR